MAYDKMASALRDFQGRYDVDSQAYRDVSRQEAALSRAEMENELFKKSLPEMLKQLNLGTQGQELKNTAQSLANQGAAGSLAEREALRPNFLENMRQLLGLQPQQMRADIAGTQAKTNILGAQTQAAEAETAGQLIKNQLMPETVKADIAKTKTEVDFINSRLREAQGSQSDQPWSGTPFTVAPAESEPSLISQTLSSAQVGSGWRELLKRLFTGSTAPSTL